MSTQSANAGDGIDASQERAARFIVDLGDIDHDSSSRNATLSKVGMVLLIVGAAVAIVGVLLSQSSNNPRDQSTQISIGLAGIAVAIVGLGLFLRYSLAQFLRFWMLRFIYEQQKSS